MSLDRRDALRKFFTSDRLVDEQDQAYAGSACSIPSIVLGPFAEPPKEIDSLVVRAVGVLPEDRFQSCAQMLEFVESMRNRKSNREELVNYLQGALPRASTSGHRLFRSSRHPVFGRKNRSSSRRRARRTVRLRARRLPIEWTAPPNTVQFQAKQVRAHAESIARNEDAIVPSDVIDSERETTSDRQANRGVMGRTRTPHLGEPDLPRIHEIAATESSADIPTQSRHAADTGNSGPTGLLHASAIVSRAISKPARDRKRAGSGAIGRGTGNFATMKRR